MTFSVQKILYTVSELNNWPESLPHDVLKYMNTIKNKWEVTIHHTLTTQNRALKTNVSTYLYSKDQSQRND
jgi:hypothetical protein